VLTTMRGDGFVWTVLARPCKPGEKFSIRTEKHCAPVIIK